MISTMNSYISTIDGEVLVQNIKKSDMIKIKDGYAPIKLIKRVVVLSTEETCPYLIPKNYYGNNVPNADTYITGDHMIYTNDNFIHSRHMHKQSKLHRGISLCYYHIMTSRHTDIIYANNLPIETFHIKRLECAECTRKHVEKLNNLAYGLF